MGPGESAIAMTARIAHLSFGNSLIRTLFYFFNNTCGYMRSKRFAVYLGLFQIDSYSL